jgi:hypothetical protein
MHKIILIDVIQIFIKLKSQYRIQKKWFLGYDTNTGIFTKLSNRTFMCFMEGSDFLEGYSND